jgi:hypothetical protein
MTANSAPHPARLDGKGIEYFAKRDRNPTSRDKSAAVANAVRPAPSADDDADAAAAAAEGAAAEEDRAEEEGGGE